MEKTAKNNEWEIIFKSPLLRSGLEIKTTVSEKYIQPAVDKGMEIIREINKGYEHK